MMRALRKSPLTLHSLGALFLLVFLLAGAKSLSPGEIILQEGLYYRTEGLQLQKRGELSRAAAAFQKAVSVKPDYAEAYNDLGVVLESMGESKKAEEAYQIALKFKPDLGSAHSNLALLYEESDRVKQAAVHWAARVRVGPPDDPWVVAARERLTKYQLPIPESDEERAQKKRKEISLAIEAGKAHREAGRWDQATASFEQALKIDPRNAEALRLLRSVETDAARSEGRKARELEAAQGRVQRESKEIRRRGAARDPELERERAQMKQLEAAQVRKIKESRRQEVLKKAKAEKNAAAARKAEAKSQKKITREKKELEEARRKGADAEQRAQKADAQSMVEAAKRVEAEKRVEVVKPEPSAAPADAQALAREIVREKSKVRGRASDDLARRATVAMREGLYQDAIEIYKQILILEPGNRSAKQGLERAQKALVKAAQ